MRFLIVLLMLIPSFASARTTIQNVEMALAVAPYFTLIGESKPLPKMGTIFAAHLASTGVYIFNQTTIEPWAMSTATSAALMCQLESSELCALTILGAGYVTYKKYDGQKIFMGLTVGVAAGTLVPAIFGTF